MRRYNPDIHTAANMIRQTQAIYEAQPDALLVGSLGRAILYRQIYGDPEYELKARGETPLHNGIKARDIDVIAGDMVGERAREPFYTDTCAFNNASVAIVRDGSEWVLTSQSRGFAEALHPATLEPVAGESFYDIPAQTLPLQTHLALYYTRGGPLRRKDDIPVALLRHASAAALTTILPAKFYKPYYRLASVKMRWTEALVRQVYQRLLPKAVEARIDQLLTR